jgi:hypothetical protein
MRSFDGTKRRRGWPFRSLPSPVPPQEQASVTALYDQDSNRQRPRRRDHFGGDVEEFRRLLALLGNRHERIARLRQSSARSEMEFPLAQANRLLHQALVVLDDGVWFDDGA